jgi:hypothetical protein
MALVGFAVVKNGKALKANENKFRTFSTREKAWNFVANQVWVSKSLTKGDFKVVKVHG